VSIHSIPRTLHVPDTVQRILTLGRTQSLETLVWTMDEGGKGNSLY